jgi:hypothetical protein
MKTKLFLALGTLAITSGFLNAQTTNPAPYCTALPGNNFLTDEITNVTLSNLNNSSTGYFSNSRYVYYNSVTVPTLTPNSVVNMSVSIRRHDCMPDFLGAYIDQNVDGNFTASELVGSVSPAILSLAPCGVFAGLPIVTFTFNISIPMAVFAPSGSRMRVIYGNNVATPCFTTVASGGEVEDYNVYFSAGNPIQVPVANFTVPVNVCKNQTITLNDNSTNTPTAWSWTLTGASPATSTLQNPAVTYTNAGTYTISLKSTNAGGASAIVSKTIAINACNVGVNETEGSDAKNITVYPNPTNGAFTIDLKASSQVSIYNVLGDKIIAKNLEPGNHTIDIAEQATGVYFLRINTENKHQHIKIIKE